MSISKYLTALYTLQFLLTAPISARPSSRHRHRMAFRGEASSFRGCCFVDMFCYAACFGDGAGSLRALAPGDGGRMRSPDEQRHRHRHHHGYLHFRSRREAADDALWRKLRLSYSAKLGEYDHHSLGT